MIETGKAGNKERAGGDSIFTLRILVKKGIKILAILAKEFVWVAQLAER